MAGLLHTWKFADWRHQQNPHIQPIACIVNTWIEFYFVFKSWPDTSLQIWRLQKHAFLQVAKMMPYPADSASVGYIIYPFTAWPRQFFSPFLKVSFWSFMTQTTQFALHQTIMYPCSLLFHLVGSEWAFDYLKWKDRFFDLLKVLNHWFGNRLQTPFYLANHWSSFQEGVSRITRVGGGFHWRIQGQLRGKKRMPKQHGSARSLRTLSKV